MREHVVEDYRTIVGEQVIDELLLLADRVRHLRLQHINSTSVGGGVAEILSRMVPLLQDLGIDTRWDVIKGNEAFFAVTKAFHNALHGGNETITKEMLQVFRDTTAVNLKDFDAFGDVVMVHDPQPVGLITRKSKGGGRWLWRCHIDVSTPDPRTWEFLKQYVSLYDGSIFSMPDFAQRLSIPQFMVPPSIDPLSEKNRELSDAEVRTAMERYELDPERPLLTQISRFDRLKDPLGVIEAYRLVRRSHDCQLLLAGGGATDDPEGQEVLQEVKEAAGDDQDIHILELPPFSDFVINALVRASTVVIQKSIKEGFGLTVTEALWKRKPVIGGATGGIKLQLLNGVTGFLVHSPEGAANRITELLANHELREAIGDAGHRYVKDNFLTTRHIRDYLLLMLTTESSDTDLSLLAKS